MATWSLLERQQDGTPGRRERSHEGWREAPGGQATSAGQPELPRARPARESPSLQLSGWMPLSVTLRSLTLAVLVVRSRGGLSLEP